MTRFLFAAATSLAFTAMSTTAAAQERRTVTVEGGGGYVVFADDGAIDHAAFGARVRADLTSRISAGPEFAYMRGPGRDRDLFLMGGVNIDVLRERRVTPYVTTAAGFMFHTDEHNSWTDFAFVVGAGARIAVTERFFIATEGRLGGPLHAGLGLSAGYRFPRRQDSRR